MLSWLERSPLPTYINAIGTQSKFYANPKALAAQGKPPEDFLNGNAYDLNDPDELERRTRLVASRERLNSYEYEGGDGFSTLTLAGFGSREWLLSRISGCCNLSTVSLAGLGKCFKLQN